MADATENHPIHPWNRDEQRDAGRINSVSGAATSIRFSPGGDYLAIGGRDGAARLFDLRRFKETPHLEDAHDKMQAMAFSGGGGMLVSGDEDGTTRFWNITPQPRAGERP